MCYEETRWDEETRWCIAEYVMKRRGGMKRRDVLKEGVFEWVVAREAGNGSLISSRIK